MTAALLQPATCAPGRRHQQPPRASRLQPATPAPRGRSLQCAAAKGGKPAAAPSPPPRSRLARLLSWRSSASAAEVAKPEAAPEASQQQQQPAAAPDDQQQQQRDASAGRFSLYSWLTWGSGSATPTAAQPSAAASGLEASQLGDGMAAVPAQPAAAPAVAGPRRRSWYSLSRRSFSGSFSSMDDADLAAQQAQQAYQQEQALAARAGHPALQLLRRRALEGSRPGARADGAKLGLVVEGGGMRGCVSGGALQALADLGLRDCFDAVYGSSAGAINATYFLSGQRDGVAIYHDHIASPEFINLKRLWKGEGAAPVLNLAFLIDHVMHAVQPLDWDAVLASPVPLKVVASSLDSLDSVLLDEFEDRHDLAACLKASATVPEIAGGPRLHRGHRLVDAAVFEAVPFRSAIADGCSHVLVLCTRPTQLTRARRVKAALADAMEVAIKKAVLSPDYMRPAWKAEVDYLARDGIGQDDMLLRALSHPEPHTLPWFGGAHVFPLYPGAAANFSPLCIDVPTLKLGVAEGRRNVVALCRALFGDTLDWAHAEELDATPYAAPAAASTSNIVPATSGSAASRLWQRYREEGMRPQA